VCVIVAVSVTVAPREIVVGETVTVVVVVLGSVVTEAVRLVANWVAFTLPQPVAWAERFPEFLTLSAYSEVLEREFAGV
jgi:hypothetical protein